MFIWTITSVNYFLLEFELRHLKGGIYKDAAASSSAEVCGCIIGGCLLYGVPSKLRIKFTLTVVYVFMLVGATAVLISETKQDGKWTPEFVLLINLGIGASYVTQSGITALLFDQ